jgi:hypothetical protein
MCVVIKRILKLTRLSALTKTNLNKQGFGQLDDEAKSRYALSLRFTPAVGTILIVIGVRHLFRAPPLPPTPKPRQFSYLLSTIMLSGSALSFHYGLPLLGFALGGMVVIGSTILATTLWCLGSWYYRLIFGHVAGE